MKKTMINQTHIEGILYEHDLTLKESGENSKNPGTKFISGTISIATDDAMTNIVPVHFTYVTATFGSGKPNDTFTTLSNIINGTFGSYMKDGADKAVKLRVDSALGLNEFYTDRNGKEELVSAKRNEGGFVHKVDALDEDKHTASEAMAYINKLYHIENEAKDAGLSLIHVICSGYHFVDGTIATGDTYYVTILGNATGHCIAPHLECRLIILESNTFILKE